ncbi:MAG: hypothetical protein H0W83_13365, partial [Planctomycetes bacterium]|nr:hypothetical protein [Planctomycetota bacterium]
LSPAVPVRVRATLGDAVMAACGQLGDPSVRRPPSPSRPVVDTRQGTV